MRKRYKAALAKVDRQKRYPLDEALNLLGETKVAKFDETVDVAVKLGIDPKQTDQMVRGSVPLPEGLGQSVRVIVFAKGEKEKEAETAGADAVGSEDLIQKVLGGWMDFDKVVATPEMMGQVSKLGRVLGPKGLMPNPKLGTVTFEVAKAVKECKAGKAEYRTDKAGIVHTIVGKVSFGPEKLKKNFLALLEAIMKAKPSSAKGVYLKGVTISTTMGPGVKLDPNQLQSLVSG